VQNPERLGQLLGLLGAEYLAPSCYILKRVGWSINLEKLEDHEAALGYQALLRAEVFAAIGEKGYEWVEYGPTYQDDPTDNKYYLDARKFADHNSSCVLEILGPTPLDCVIQLGLKALGGGK
jgi:hypothetical protein